MRYLRTNTATRATVGPFFDATDGVTPETALTATSEKLTFMVDSNNVPTLVIDANATGSGGGNDLVHVTNDDAGFYDLELTASDTNFLGRAMLAITNAAAHVPVFHEFMIVPANVYDALTLGSDSLQVVLTAAGVDAIWDEAQSGHSTAGTFGRYLDAIVSGIGGGSITAEDLGVIDTGTAQGATSTTIQLRAAADFGTADIIGATVVVFSGTSGKGQARIITAYNGGTDTATVDTWNTTPSGTITYKVFASAPASASNPVPVDVVRWKGATAPDNSGDTFVRIGAPVGASISADIAAVSAKLPALVGGRVDASVGAMAANVLTASALATDAVAELADGVWDEAIAGHLTAGSTGASLNAAGSSGDPWTTVLPGAYGAGTAGNIVGNRLDAVVSTRASQTSLDANSTSVLAIKAKTDSLTFTKAGEVDANVQSVNDTTVNGSGTVATPWGP